MATRQIGFLTDMKIITAIDKHGYPNALNYLLDESNIAVRIARFSLWLNLSVIVGLIIGFIISRMLTKVKGDFEFNPVVMLLLALILNKLGFFGNNTINSIVFSFGNLFTNLGLQFKFIASGILLSIISLVIFFFSRSLTHSFRACLKR